MSQTPTCTNKTGGGEGWRAHASKGLIFEKHITGKPLKTEALTLSAESGQRYSAKVSINTKLQATPTGSLRLHALGLLSIASRTWDCG